MTQFARIPWADTQSPWLFPGTRAGQPPGCVPALGKAKRQLICVFNYGYVMIAEFMRAGARSLPTHPTPSEVTALRVWHCKYKSLEGLSDFVNLKTLVIATYPDADFAPLTGLSTLEYLSIVHLPKVSDLAPLSQLQD